MGGWLVYEPFGILSGRLFLELHIHIPSPVHGTAPHGVPHTAHLVYVLSCYHSWVCNHPKPQRLVSGRTTITTWRERRTATLCRRLCAIFLAPRSFADLVDSLRLPSRFVILMVLSHPSLCLDLLWHHQPQIYRPCLLFAASFERQNSFEFGTAQSSVENRVGETAVKSCFVCDLGFVEMSRRTVVGHTVYGLLIPGIPGFFNRYRLVNDVLG